MEPLKHVCGSQGFGLSIHDVCPACEFFRLTGLEVPEGIARQAAELRGYMNPDISRPPIMLRLQEQFQELEKEYGKKIP